MFGFAGVEDEIWGELVLHPGLFDCLRRLGYTDVTFTDGYVISKPPQSPQLFWHYDWFTWVEPEDFRPAPQQVFAMYYLTDTSRHNGCLRVIPGSHYRHNPLHEVIGQPHSEELHPHGGCQPAGVPAGGRTRLTCRYGPETWCWGMHVCCNAAHWEPERRGAHGHYPVVSAGLPFAARSHPGGRWWRSRRRCLQVGIPNCAVPCRR